MIYVIDLWFVAFFRVFACESEVEIVASAAELATLRNVELVLACDDDTEILLDASR